MATALGDLHVADGKTCQNMRAVLGLDALTTKRVPRQVQVLPCSGSDHEVKSKGK